MKTECSTVHELRQAGCKVCVKHIRYDNPCRHDPSPFDPKGGMTLIDIDTPEGAHYQGVAVCCAKDNYNKKMGVKIALNRAFFAGPIPSTERFLCYIPSLGWRKGLTKTGQRMLIEQTLTKRIENGTN